jgi:hypothetical protein
LPRAPASANARSASSAGVGRGFLRIVHVEGNARDAGRVAESLRQGGVVGVIDVVTDEAAFVAALDGADVVLSDFTASAFGGTAALKVAQRRRPEVPFLFVSDTCTGWPPQ